MKDLTTFFGPPGCGKTTQLMTELGELVAGGVPVENIVYTSFTRAAIDVAKSRVREVVDVDDDALEGFGTLHAICGRLTGFDWKRRLLSETTRQGQDLYRQFGRTEGFTFDFTGDVDMEADGGTGIAAEGNQLLAWYGWARQSCLDTDDAIDRWRVTTTSTLTPARQRRFVECYTSFKRDLGLADFTDVLVQADHTGADPRAEVLILDEAQDLSPLQWRIIDRWRENTTRTFFGGDDDQCQPPGTMVLTNTGAIPIENLDPALHRLVSYDRQKSEVVGFRNGYTFTKAVRPYRGDLFTVTAGGATTRCTPDHRWLARWTDTARQSNVCVVYLMQKESRFRVGWCQLFNSEGIFHLGARARLENADAAWILKVCYQRTEASIWESFYAAEYGIPTIPFRAVQGANHITTEAIDELFGLLGHKLVDRAYRLLTDLSLDETRPIWTRQKAYERRGGTSNMVIEAVNFIDNLMSIPVVGEVRHVRWEPVTVTKDHYDGPVYSLAVEPYHLYIANGMVTHNCIYSFQGSDASLFLDRTRDGAVVTLDQSRRLPRASWQVATWLSSLIRTRQDKPFRPMDADGLALERMLYGLPIEDDGSTWFILARNTYLLAGARAQLERRGIPYTSRRGFDPVRVYYPAARAITELARGRAIARDDLAMLVRYLDDGDVDPYLTRRLQAARLRELPRTITQHNLEDLGFTERFRNRLSREQTPVSMLSIRSARGKPLAATWNYLVRLQRDYGDDVFSRTPRVQLSTIHGVKGDEADNVALLSDCSPATHRTLDLDPDSEHRVWYVGVSRARKNLYVLAPTTDTAYPWFAGGQWRLALSGARG